MFRIGGLLVLKLARKCFFKIIASLNRRGNYFNGNGWIFLFLFVFNWNNTYHIWSRSFSIFKWKEWIPLIIKGKTVILHPIFHFIVIFQIFLSFQIWHLDEIDGCLVFEVQTYVFYFNFSSRHYLVSDFKKQKKKKLPPSIICKTQWPKKKVMNLMHVRGHLKVIFALIKS